MKIAHLSDIHFGKIAHPEIVDALVDEVNQLEVDLVAVSGDLTQRARVKEFAAAANMLEAFDTPTLVVPGNHDVYAWWRPFARLLQPLQRFRQHISDDLTPTFERSGVAVLGINSAYGRTVKGGHIGRGERKAIRQYFGGQSGEVFKVLVVHHHLTRIQALGRHSIARDARKTLDVVTRMEVDLILCGHLHVSHIEPVEIVPDRHRLVIASAGTATSSRGRKSNRRTNFYNLINITLDTFSVEERRYHPHEQRFYADCSTQFERHVAAAVSD